MRKLILLIIALAAFNVWMLSGIFAHGDADWIMRGGLRNAAGEWCCGKDDCVAIPAERVTYDKGNYIIWPQHASADRLFSAIDKVPEREAMPSRDGRYWRCHRPDGTRRCFFAPPPSM